MPRPIYKSEERKFMWKVMADNKLVGYFNSIETFLKIYDKPYEAMTASKLYGEQDGQ